MTDETNQPQPCQACDGKGYGKGFTYCEPCYGSGRKDMPEPKDPRKNQFAWAKRVGRISWQARKGE